MQFVIALLLLATPMEVSMTGKLQVTSPAFRDNEAIPTEFSCDGRNVSPPLAWSGVPAETKSIAILVDDPDAPKKVFTHWLVTGLAPTTTSLPKGAALSSGATASNNDMGKTGWAGPCPPGGRHHYHFHVYALDTQIPKPSSRGELLAAIRGHVLAEGELVGTFQHAR